MPRFQHPISASEFRKIMYQLTDFICEYYEQGVEQLPVRSQVHKGDIIDKIPKNAPLQKEEWDAVWKDFQDIVMPGITHWQSPNFFAYFPANSSYPGILGEVLSGAINMIGFTWMSSPAATELEMAVMDQLARLLQLPEKFMCGKGDGVGGGVIQGTASEALLVAIIAARARKTRNQANQYDCSKLVVYSSDQAHSSLQKNCQILGLSNLRLLPTSKQDDWALNPTVFREAVEKDLYKGLIPCILQINVGTTSTAAVDPIFELSQICSEYGIWSHVDAAYAGSAAICPEIRQQYFRGVEEVDSFNFNLHKWLLTNFDCSALWVSDSNNLNSVLSITPVYLQSKENSLDLKDWQIPLGRRFRSLKVWLVLRLYGVEGLQAKLRYDMALAKWFAQQVEQDPLFQLTSPQRFGLVCFKAKNRSNNFNKRLLDSLNDTGKLFMVHTEVGGEFMLRFAVGGLNTRYEHVEAAWNLIRQTTVEMTNADDSSLTNGSTIQ